MCSSRLPASAVIEVKNLSKTYTLSCQQKKEMGPQFTGDTLDEVDDISFTCEPGRVYGLLGPNGAGKTLAAILAGLFAAFGSVRRIMGNVWGIPDIPKSMLGAARSILTPSVVAILLSLLIPIIFPAFLGLRSGFSLNTTTALIPVLNVALATKDALAGTVGAGHLALVYASLLVLPAASLGVCMFVVRSERVLFRT